MQLPLEGIRVIDLTVIWAGNGATMLLGDLGAEVIKVESIHHFPPNTRGNDHHTYNDDEPAPYRDLRYPGWQPGRRPFNRAAQFNGHSYNKHACTMDLDQPLGREAFLRLVERSDVLVENNSPRVLRKLDLEYPVLSKVNPRLVMVRMPGMGLDGPYAEYIGFGASFNSLAGITAISGHHGTGPETAGANYHMDEVTPPSAAFAVLAALLERERTGRGMQVELGQAENLLFGIGERVLEAQLGTPGPPAILGNFGEEVVQGYLATTGHDGGLVIALRHDDDWRSLLSVMGSPGWSGDPRLASHGGRLAHQRELFELIGMWTASRNRDEIFELLQAAGVPCGPVLSETQALSDPQLAARNYFRPLDHPEAGHHLYPTFPWRASAMQLAWNRPAPLLGEHNEYVYREVLGYSDTEYEKVKESGMIGTDYSAGRP
jgi:crotonobetainyl-CoA:carnitine CoA-transferase CaiB-like acyl-CoA transferase